MLIVDDDKLSSRMVGLMVENEGHRTFIVNSWTAAIETFAKEDIDLVLMDAVMPTVDGFKLTSMLRQRATSYVPVVFITGLKDSATRLRAIESGGDDLLTKPVDELELKVRLMAMLRIRRLTHALEVRTRRLAQLASIDNLTGLLNRRSLDEHLAEQVEEALSGGGTLCAMMLDIDHFKLVNDTHGHDVGDIVIAGLSQVLDEVVRPTDLAFRYGGEEFVVLCPDTSLERAEELADRLRTIFAERTEASSPAGRQTLSVGVSATIRLGLSADCSNADYEAELLRAADRALYEAKAQGRDRVVVFCPDTERP